MNVQFLSNDNDLIKSIKTFFYKKDGAVFVQKAIESFFKSCVQRPSNIFIIQPDVYSETETLGFIKDLRTYFGAFPLILIIGNKSTVKNSTNFLNVGADNVFESPLDLVLLEDFLGHRLQNENFLPIHYRNLPSGGSSIEVSRPIELTQISSEGISFNSLDFMTRGAIFDFEIGQHLEMSFSSLKCRVLSSENNNEDYSYFAEYFDISDDLKKEIRFILKKNNPK